MKQSRAVHRSAFHLPASTHLPTAPGAGEHRGPDHEALPAQSLPTCKGCVWSEEENIVSGLQQPQGTRPSAQPQKPEAALYKQ